MLIRLPYTKVNQDKPINRRDISQANKLFETKSEQNLDDGVPLKSLMLQQEQHKQPRNKNSKLSAYMQDQISSYSQRVLDNIKIFYNFIKIISR